MFSLGVKAIQITDRIGDKTINAINIAPTDHILAFGNLIGDDFAIVLVVIWLTCPNAV